MGRVVSLVFAVLLLCSIASFAASITVNPIADASVSYGFGSVQPNNGTGVSLSNQSVNYWPFWSEIMMSFDLSSIPDGAVVSKATFGWLYTYPATDGDSPTGRSNWFYQSSEAWDEMNVTYTNAPAAGSSLFISSTGPGWANVGTWQTVVSDLTNADNLDDGLANWVTSALVDNTLATNGWRIHGPQDANTGANYASRETSTKPYLTIEYNVVPEPSSFLALCVGVIPFIIKKRRG